MKVLFAVHDEKVSLSIVKKYQKEYKEIISYKNVYYFNAIIKELQRDKNYDRIVIDEELEEFTSSSFEQKDKFIFDKLDSITDEASNMNGNDIPIILICSERRVKSEEILVKMFGIGIYNAIIGNDRSTDEVCRLIYRPRSKKEAKVYYRIDSEDVSYKHENEDDVSEEEMQYILSYFKKIGKNEEKYAESFRNINSQYNERQMRVIISILPIHVRSVLEEVSPEYQRLVTSGAALSVKGKNALAKRQEKSGTSEKLLTDKKSEVGKPIVVPSKMDNTTIKKLTIRKPVVNNIEPPKPKVQEIDEDDEFEEILRNISSEDIEKHEPIQEEPEVDIVNEQKEPKKRGRGRPRKYPVVEETEPKVPKKRGRPRKNPIIEEDLNDKTEEIETPKTEKNNRFNEFEDIDDLLDFEDVPTYEENKNRNILPGFDDEDFEEDEDEKETRNANHLQGFDTEFDDDDFEEDDEEDLNRFEASKAEKKDDDEDALDNVLPGFEDLEDDEEENEDKYEAPNQAKEPEQKINSNQPNEDFQIFRPSKIREEKLPDNKEPYFDYTEYNRLLSSTRKVIAFVGTSKNGTSFIVNNVAKTLSDNGVDTAILDATKNKNAYYIYTKNEEELRQKAVSSIERLINGRPEGIKVKNNLTVYTELPNQDENMNNVGRILETLIKNHSAVLIDCDFETPLGYLDKAQEIYLVQSMDVLTIQPLTAYLRELKGREILDEDKIRIILNKTVRLKGVTSKTIVGGMSYYNDPEMSFMTELFNRNMITPIEIPFDQSVYESYLQQIIECEIRTDRYPKEFKMRIEDLSSVIYPLLPAKSSKNKKGYQYDTNINNYSNPGFSNSVNNTLNDMRNKMSK